MIPQPRNPFAPKPGVAASKPVFPKRAVAPKMIAPPRYVPPPAPQIRAATPTRPGMPNSAAPPRYLPAAAQNRAVPQLKPLPGGPARPVAAQLKLAVPPRPAPPRFIPSPITVQRAQQSVHMKRFKNVITLGIRKAYVKHKRAQQAAALHGAPALVPIDNRSDLDKYVDAYKEARFYHNTWEAAVEGTGKFAPGIRVGGLLASKGGTGLAAASGFGNDIDYNKRTIHLADESLGGYYQGMMGATARMRPFLPADRTQKHGVHWGGPFEEGTEGHLHIDKEHGKGAWITGVDIPPEAINFGTNEELADLEDDTIFEIIGTHWDGPVPDASELRQLHKQALRERRLSL